MAPKNRKKSAEAGSKGSNPKQTMKSKLHINAHEGEGHPGASVRSENRETMLQDTANAAGSVPAEPLRPLNSIEPVDPPESAEVPSPPVPLEGNGRRLHSGQRNPEWPTEDERELSMFFVAEDFRRQWISDEKFVAATTLLKTKRDPNFKMADVQKEGEDLTRRGHRCS